MIEIDKTPRFKTADGQLFATLEESQIHAVGTVVVGMTYDIARDVVKNSDSIVAILKMKPRKQKAKIASKPKSAPKAATVAK